MLKDVVDVSVLDGYRLLLTFEGGEQREVDIKAIVPFDGVFEPLADGDTSDGYVSTPTWDDCVAERGGCVSGCAL